MKIDHVIETLRAHAKPGNSYGALADKLAKTGNFPAYRMVRDEPAPPPVAATTMDVARYEIRISEAQRVLLLTALAQCTIISEHCGDSGADANELREMLSAADQLPTCNDFTL